MLSSHLGIHAHASLKWRKARKTKRGSDLGLSVEPLATPAQAKLDRSFQVGGQSGWGWGGGGGRGGRRHPCPRGHWAQRGHHHAAGWLLLLGNGRRWRKTLTLDKSQWKTAVFCGKSGSVFEAFLVAPVDCIRTHQKVIGSKTEKNAKQLYA